MTDGRYSNTSQHPAGVTLVAAARRTWARASGAKHVFVLFLLLLCQPLSAKAQETAAAFTDGSVRVGYDNRTCDTTLEGAIRYSSSPYHAVTFDGTTDHLSATAATVGVADSNQVTGSFWFRLNATGIDMNFQHHTSASRFSISYEGSCNCISIGGKNAAGTQILFIVGPTITDNNWHHLAYSFDMSQPSATHAHLYLDDADTSPTINTFTSGPLDLNQSGIGVGGFVTGAAYDGDLAGFWFDTSYMDLSVESNRRKFISAAGLPVYLGTNGSLPNGAAPDIFLTGPVSGWHGNKGAGGGFTLNGALTPAANQPGNGRGAVELCDGTAWHIWGG